MKTEPVKKEKGTVKAPVIKTEPKAKAKQEKPTARLVKQDPEALTPVKVKAPKKELVMPDLVKPVVRINLEDLAGPVQPIGPYGQLTPMKHIEPPTFKDKERKESKAQLRGKAKLVKEITDAKPAPKPSKGKKHLEDLKELLQPAIDSMGGNWRQQHAVLSNIVETLMNGWDVFIGGVQHKMAEVEVNYHGPGHEDPYCAQDPGKQEFAAIHFCLKSGSGKSKNKSVELVFGSKEKGIYAAILFRALIDLSDDHIYESVTGLIDRITKINKMTWSQLTAIPTSKFCACGRDEIRLEPAAKPRNERVWEAPRVGLTLLPAEPDQKVGRPDDYYIRTYRMSTCPERIFKCRPGYLAATYASGDRERAGMLGIGGLQTVEFVNSVNVGLVHSNYMPFMNRDVTNAKQICELVGAMQAHMRKLLE